MGAMAFFNDSDEAKSNCVNLICSVLANADDRKTVARLKLATERCAEKQGDDV